MLYKDLYWYFQSALSKEICNNIIKTGLAGNIKTASLATMNPDNLTKKEINILKKIRKSNASFIKEKWIYDIIHPYIEKANINAGWNYSLMESESCQFTVYNKNSFYDWHTDAFNRNDGSKINRKLSLVINLSDPKDYKGGILEFCNPLPNKKHKIIKAFEILPQGSICVFTSYTWHRVTPIIKGLRYSLVNWTNGENLK